MLPALRGGSDQDGSARPRIQTRCRLVVVAALRVIRSGLPGISLRYSGILICLVDISAHGEVRLRFRVGDFPAGGCRRSRHAVLALVFGELPETLVDLFSEVIVHFLEIVDGNGNLSAGLAIALLAAADEDADVFVLIRFILDTSEDVSRGESAFGAVVERFSEIGSDNEGASVGIESGRDFFVGLISSRCRLTGGRGRLLGGNLRLHFVRDGLLDFGSENNGG